MCILGSAHNINNFQNFAVAILKILTSYFSYCSVISRWALLIMYIFWFNSALQVPNVVPSISAITGGFTPERYIWRYGMAYVSWPRTFDSFLIYRFFTASSLNKEHWYSILNKISWLCYVIEHVSLFALTYVSSTENYGWLFIGLWQWFLCYQSYREIGKSPYTALYHHDLKGKLRNSFEPLVAVLYIPLTYSINNHYLHLKNCFIT